MGLNIIIVIIILVINYSNNFRYCLLKSNARVQMTIPSPKLLTAMSGAGCAVNWLIT